MVCLPAWKVRVEIWERRTAFLGTLEDEVVRAADVGEDRRREDSRTAAKLGNHIAQGALPTNANNEVADVFGAAFRGAFSGVL